MKVRFFSGAWLAGAVLGPSAALSVSSISGLRRPVFTTVSGRSIRPRGRPCQKSLKTLGLQTPSIALLLARLEKAGLRPGREADKVTLLRRVTYDLTGLPPTRGDGRVSGR